MTELTTAEERIRQILIERAKKADPRVPRTALITYGDLCAQADPDQAYWRGPRYRGIGSRPRPRQHLGARAWPPFALRPSGAEDDHAGR